MTETTAKTIRQKVVLHAKPMEVYEAYLDSKKQTAFTGSRATSDPKVGGKFTAWDGYITGEYLELEPGKKILQEWRSSDFPDGSAAPRFEIDLKETEGGTELSIVHSGVPVEIAEDIA